MESPIKLTGQGIRDLNSRGPKKKPAVPAEAVAPVTDAVSPDAVALDATAPDGAPIAVPAPSTDDVTTPAAVNHG